MAQAPRVRFDALGSRILPHPIDTNELIGTWMGHPRRLGRPYATKTPKTKQEANSAEFESSTLTAHEWTEVRPEEAENTAYQAALQMLSEGGKFNIKDLHGPTKPFEG